VLAKDGTVNLNENGQVTTAWPSLVEFCTPAIKVADAIG
jgi:hypothetical protein